MQVLTNARARCFALVASLTLLARCDSPTATRAAQAYDPTTLTGGVLYRWPSGTTVRVWVAGVSASTPVDLGLAVREAMQRWNAVPQFAEFTLVTADDINSADVVVYDRVTDAPVLPGTCAFDPRSSAGYTYFCAGSGTPAIAQTLPLAAGTASNVHVVIRVDRGRVTTQSGYNAVLAHEFGHALGIGAHSDVASDLMFGSPTAEMPSSRDIATLRAVLGATPALRLR